MPTLLIQNILLFHNTKLFMTLLPPSSMNPSDLPKDLRKVTDTETVEMILPVEEVHSINWYIRNIFISFVFFSFLNNFSTIGSSDFSAFTSWIYTPFPEVIHALFGSWERIFISVPILIGSLLFMGKNIWHILNRKWIFILTSKWLIRYSKWNISLFGWDTFTDIVQSKGNATVGDLILHRGAYTIPQSWKVKQEKVYLKNIPHVSEVLDFCNSKIQSSTPYSKKWTIKWKEIWANWDIPLQIQKRIGNDPAIFIKKCKHRQSLYRSIWYILSGIFILWIGLTMWAHAFPWMPSSFIEAITLIPLFILLLLPIGIIFWIWFWNSGIRMLYTSWPYCVGTYENLIIDNKKDPFLLSPLWIFGQKLHNISRDIPWGHFSNGIHIQWTGARKTLLLEYAPYKNRENKDEYLIEYIYMNSITDAEKVALLCRENIQE